jgi:hypothetical protein
MQDGNVFYRRQLIYSIPGKLALLADHIIAGCRYGGPIGTVIAFRFVRYASNKVKHSVDEGHDQSRPPQHSCTVNVESTGPGLLVSRGGPASCRRTYSSLLSARARSMNSIQWDQSKIIRFGWTQDERLVVLNEEGVYRLYDLQGEYRQYSLGSEAGEVGVIDARIHESGLVALTGSLSLLEVKGWEGGRPLELANPGELLRTLYEEADSVAIYRSFWPTTLLGGHPPRS